MRDRLEMRELRLFPISIKPRVIAATLMMVVLASCASQSSRDAEIAAAEAEQVALEQEAARFTAAQERARTVELQRQRERAAAERERLQAERDIQVAEAAARAQVERELREAAQQREQARLAVIAAAEAQRQEKLDRVDTLEQQIASLQAGVTDEASRTASLALAIETAEELLATLAEEQAKYENTDGQGNTLEPLAKELLAELESRKNELMRQANSQ